MAPVVITGRLLPYQSTSRAAINVGGTYIDLGAIATDNEGHTLGYKTFLNGTLTIDASNTDTSTTL